MSACPRSFLVLAAGLALAAGARGEEPKPYTGAGCAAAVDDFFEDEVWAKVGAQVCLTCHKKGGDAEDSKFVLRDPRQAHGAARTRRCGTTATPSPAWPRVKEKDQSRLLAEGGRRARPRRRGRAQAGLGRAIASSPTFVRRVNAPAGHARRHRRRGPEGAAVLRRRRRCSTTAGCSAASRCRSPAGCRPTPNWPPSPKDGLQGAARDPRRGDEGGRLLRPASRGVQRHLPDARRRRERRTRRSSPTSTSRRPGSGTRSTT